MGILDGLAGRVRLEVMSADGAGLLDALLKEDIQLWDVEPGDGLETRLSIRRSDYRRAIAVCERLGAKVRILRRLGLYWLGKRMLKRPVLLAGLCFLLAAVLWLPTHILFVQVEGNTSVPARLILAAAEDCGICLGASRREIRSERMKNALMEALPQLQWAGVNTYGCVAVISVREKTPAEERKEASQVSSIVASADGIILTATATGGSLQCQPGQAVVKGQVLISGYTDCGLTIQATRAEGEIYARTSHSLTVISPANCLLRQDIAQTHVSYSILFGKNRINLWKDSGISGTTCGRMYEEYYITLPGGFTLPVALVKETVTEYETVSVETAPEEAMSDFAGDYLLSQLIAATIDDREERFSRNGEVFRLEVTFGCTEMIGRQRAEEIGDIHG